MDIASNNGVCWYNESGTELAKQVQARLNDISERQSYLQDKNQVFLCMYGNTSDFGYGSIEVDYSDPIQGLTLNVVQVVIDTLSSKVGESEPRPYFLTDEGNWKKQENAQKLNKFTYGQFYRAKTYKKAKKAFLCASIFGTGLLKHYIKDGEIHTDWVIPDEIFVDQREAMYGEPKSMFQVRYVAREVLASQFPTLKDQINDLPYDAYDMMGEDTLSNMVKVVEAWHLPSGKDAKDGKHVICVKDIVLSESAYTRNKFPFTKFEIFDPVLGWYGRGVAEMLAPIQLEINKTIKKISKALHLISVPRVFIERNAKVQKSHINNDIGNIIEYDGKQPIFDVARSVSPELANYLENLYAKAFEIIGISQLSAQSKKPVGLNSGKALREYNDIETERFKRISKGWEDFHLDITEHYVELGKEIYAKDKDYAVTAISSEGIEKIKWKEIDLKEDSAVMQVYPTSMLPKHPAGRLEFTQELLQAGFIGQEEGLELLQFPDIKSVTNLKTSNYKMAKKIINGFLDSKFIEPDVYHQNASIMPYVQNALVYYETQGLDEDRLDLFRMWIDQALLLINPPKQQQTELEGEVDAINEDQINEAQQISDEQTGELPPA